VIDSIQTMWTDTVESAPGTVTQVRASAQALIRFAKRSGAAVIPVGHVTKDGQIAGPRVVEHMVDAVLSFAGGGSQQFRILRSGKNRFGPTDGVGVVRGRALLEAITTLARQEGANKVSILSDPNAVNFYRHMGARHIGDAPSDAIPGRRLPLLEYDLRC